MRLLLDTHVLIWQLSESERIGVEANRALARADEIYVSALLFAEVGFRISVGKLRVSDQFEATAVARQVLPLRPEHGLAVAGLPLHHRDPFDRLLIAQARMEGLTIVTADSAFAKYEVPLIDASV